MTSPSAAEPALLPFGAHTNRTPNHSAQLSRNLAGRDERERSKVATSRNADQPITHRTPTHRNERIPARRSVESWPPEISSSEG